MAVMELPTDYFEPSSCPTKPMREPESRRWEQGDVVQSDGVRWVISYIPHDRSAVHLHRMNDSGCIWKTTLSKLPKKGTNR